nr:7438_t:CDS:2 [Entrophospora candida]
MLIFKGNNFNGLCFSKTLSKEEKAVVALTNESKKQSHKLFKKEYNPEFVKLAIDASLVSHTSITTAAECSRSFYKFLKKWVHLIHSLSEWTKETPEISIKENKENSLKEVFELYLTNLNAALIIENYKDSSAYNTDGTAIKRVAGTEFVILNLKVKTD